MEYLDPQIIAANPYQPRLEFTGEELHALARSIKEYGILQPLVVRKTEEGYQLIAGERRLRAARLLKLTKVPVIVADFTDQASATLALIENIQRQNLNPLEEALGYKLLREEFALTQEDIARKTGKSRSYIANILRLLHLAPGVQHLLLQNRLTMGQAKPLLAVTDQHSQLNLAHSIIEKNLSARQVEKLVKKAKILSAVKDNINNKEREISSDYQKYLEDMLRRRLGTDVKLKLGENKSTLELTFYSQEDLERLLDIIDPPQQEETKTPKGFCI